MPAFIRLALAVSVLASPAFSTRATTPGKTYAPVRVSYAADSDPDLAALVASLRNAAKAKQAEPFETAMAPSFVALDCAANPLKACAPGKAKIVGGKAGKPLERMRLAFCCEGKASPDTPVESQDETMFAILAATLDAKTIGPNPDAKGEVCAPALPAFDRAKAGKAAKAAGVEPENLRVATVDMPLRRRPTREYEPAATIEAGALAPIVTDLTDDTPAGWTAVGLPDGSVGYTDALGFDELAPAAICFGKAQGQWRIVSTIQRDQ
ncbi:MAG: hypothetical protein KGM42_19850 [Hyphomicrobiales bacterium]|nr:hypothetical protein [Hyphomicrobiales bacterium]